MASSIKEQQRKSKKLHFSLETPYSAVSWPDISSEDQEIFLELLASLLSPLGTYRREHIQASKGKRARTNAEAKATQQELVEVPPPLGLADYITIGINETTEVLSAHTRALLPSSFPQHLKADDGEQSPLKPCPVAIFVTPGPVHLTAHLPLLATSSQLDAESQPRLVRLSQSSQNRLAEALAIPRVSTLGVLDCPEARRLLDLVKARVKPVSVQWLNSRDRHFMGTAIKAIAPSEEQWKKREKKRRLKTARRSKRGS